MTNRRFNMDDEDDDGSKRMRRDEESDGLWFMIFDLLTVLTTVIDQFREQIRFLSPNEV